MRLLFLLILLLSIGSKELVNRTGLNKSENILLIDDTPENETEKENQDSSEEEKNTEYVFSKRMSLYDIHALKPSSLYCIVAFIRSSFLEIHNPPPE